MAQNKGWLTNAAPPGRRLGNLYVIPWTWLVPEGMLSNHMWYCRAPRITSVLPQILETDGTLFALFGSSFRFLAIMLLWSLGKWVARSFLESALSQRKAMHCCFVLLLCLHFASVGLLSLSFFFFSWGGCFFLYNTNSIQLKNFYFLLLICSASLWLTSVSLFRNSWVSPLLI